MHEITNENKQLQKELKLTQNLVEWQKDTISFAKELIKHYKVAPGVSTEALLSL